MPLVIITLALPQSHMHQNHSIDHNMQTWGLSITCVVKAIQEITLFFYQVIHKICKLLHA